MGHGLSCSRDADEHDLLRAAQAGDLHSLDGLLAADPALALRATIYDRFTALHIAAANGRLQVVSMLLDRGVHPDVVSRKKQTPLMLAAMHGNTDCVLRLLHAGANVSLSLFYLSICSGSHRMEITRGTEIQILTFESVHARTCLHHAAYYGHTDCLQAILAAAQAVPVAASWGFARFVNVSDEHGATPLHLAARQGHPACVRLLLDKGAIVSAPTAAYGFPGSTALHLAARAGNLDCIRELLAWGADRLQRDSVGRIAYAVALKRGHAACAALLNPSAAEAHGVALPTQVHRRTQGGRQGSAGRRRSWKPTEVGRGRSSGAPGTVHRPLRTPPPPPRWICAASASSRRATSKAGLRAPDVRGVHAGAVLPQQAQPDDSPHATTGLPLLPHHISRLVVASKAATEPERQASPSLSRRRSRRSREGQQQLQGALVGRGIFVQDWPRLRKVGRRRRAHGQA
ncbi:hypothetical protein GUJ93_ZPchr0001g30372 [Zizania palustris]|uniref:Uncharacterized protein n=1 Tax=Zizania palustris TaxID=103762 RepID=A0A8J5V1B7_ZIZPA|nr:hypothetical protein GUJ93_ZPchr0001g30372 [Zizania palustris]